MGIVADLQMQVGGAPLHSNSQQIINMHREILGDSPHNDAKWYPAQDDLGNGRARALSLSVRAGVRRSLEPRHGVAGRHCFYNNLRGFTQPRGIKELSCIGCTTWRCAMRRFSLLILFFLLASLIGFAQRSGSAASSSSSSSSSSA